jgi:hypothetical protein
VNVKAKDPKAEPMWEYKQVVINKGGSDDPNAWTCTFDFDGAPVTVDLVNKDVHVPFDYQVSRPLVWR